jgi:hypothetical protein
MNYKGNIHSRLVYPAIGCLMLAALSCITTVEGTWFYIKAIAIPVVLLIIFFPIYLSASLSRMSENNQKILSGIYWLGAIVMGILPFAAYEQIVSPIIGNVYLYDWFWLTIMALYFWVGTSLHDPDNIARPLAAILSMLSILLLIGFFIYVIFGVGFLFWCLPAFFVLKAIAFFDLAR